MKISYIERNGRRYAYTCTSRRTPGRKNPVSEMTYLGVVDPVSGEIIPKKSRIPKPVSVQDEVDMKSFGDALLVMTIAERLGIIEDLETAFGERHRMILAIALAEAIRPSHTDLIDAVLKSSSIPELLGIQPSEVSKRNVMRTVNSIDRDSMNEFFRLRWMRVGGRAMVFSHPVSLSDNSYDTLGDLSGLADLDDATISIVTSADGTMVGFSFVQRPPTDVSHVIEMAELMRSVGIDCTYVSSTSISASVRLDELILHDIDFVIPYSVASPQFRSLSYNCNDLHDSQYTFEHDGTPYQMKESSAELMMGEGRYILTPARGLCADTQGVSLKSFMVFDPRINREAVKSMSNLVRSLTARLDGIATDDPEMTLSASAGQLAHMLRYTRKSDGTLSVSVKRGAMADFRENAGKALILTRTSSWDDIIRARETLKSINTVTGEFYKRSRWMLKYVGKNVDIEGQMFEEFIALLIYDSMHRTLESCRKNDSIEEIMFIASTYQKATIGGKTVRSPMNGKLRKVFGIFGLDSDA